MSPNKVGSLSPEFSFIYSLTPILGIDSAGRSDEASTASGS